MCLIAGSAYHKNPNAKVERANSVIGDTLRVFTKVWKDEWESLWDRAVFAITGNNVALTPGPG